MNTATMWQTNSTSSDETERLGERLGKRLRGGEVIELVSDLGGGKTTLVRGLARGLGSTDTVASPTFTISKLYRAKELTLNHFDFYRLNHPGIIASELFEVLNDPRAVTVVEWGGIVADVLPDKRISIKITPTGDDARQIECTLPTEKSYILEGVLTK